MEKEGGVLSAPVPLTRGGSEQATDTDLLPPHYSRI